MQQAFTERVSLALRSLYSRYGYSQYTMSKFEEYDLYARNKDFLISDNVITFTDLGGKLMALKPDVTLSIVKNTPDTAWVQKLWYNENVYRVNKGDRGFREIMQLGLECIGPVDDYAICEVLLLAAESLRCISERCILDISHLGLLSSLIDGMGISQGGKAKLLACIGEKNRHELTKLCRDFALPEEDVQTLCGLVALNGTPAQVMSQLKALLKGRLPEPVAQLERIFAALQSSLDMLRLDFSVVDDLHYYNGIAFKGFVDGVPTSVLSGGQYDKLMKKMKRSAGAIGFAVYMDRLERLEEAPDGFDVDVLLLYGVDAEPAAVQAEAQRLRQQGISVLAQQTVPENLRYRQLRSMEVGTC